MLCLALRNRCSYVHSGQLTNATNRTELLYLFGQMNLREGHRRIPNGSPAVCAHTKGLCHQQEPRWGICAWQRDTEVAAVRGSKGLVRGMLYIVPSQGGAQRARGTSAWADPPLGRPDDVFPEEVQL